MRELKFKGKRLDTGEWAYGGYHKHIKRQLSPVGDELKDGDICHLIIQSGFADWNMPKPLQAVEVDPETVGQYTGLNDRNGKEIYERDVIRFKADPPFTFDYSREVKFIDSFFGVESQNHKDRWEPLTRNLMKYTEITGNRWDNPELMEGKI